MKITTLVCSLATGLLSACGGGSPEPSAPAPVIASVMSKYVGTWSRPCNDHALATLTISDAGKDTIAIAEKTEFFSQQDCTGTVLGTISTSAGRTAVFQSSLDADIVLNAGTPSVPSKVDMVLSSAPAITYSMSGPAVFAMTNTGQDYMCTDLRNGQSRCASVGTQAPLPANFSAMHVSDNKFYDLFANGNGYIADKVYIKR